MELPAGPGFLVRCHHSPDDFAADDWPDTDHRFQGENFDRNLDVVKAVNSLAQAKGVAPSLTRRSRARTPPANASSITREDTAMPHSADRLTLGATTITYLVDGSGEHNPDTMLPGLHWEAHPGSLTHGHLVLTFGAFLVRVGGRNILVDLGIGNLDMHIPGLAHIKGGRLLKSLAEQGLSPEDIDTVVYTHLHLDHIGWTSDVPPTLHGQGANTPSGLTFGRARHLMAEPEWRYWTAGEGAHEMGGPDPVATLRPLAGVIEFVQSSDTIAPGVTAEDTAGHTPGHLAVVVRDPSGASAESVLIAGDIFHAPVEMAEPTCVFSTDVDPDQARKVRNRILQRPDTIIAAGHFTDGVFGRVTPAGIAYTWTPVTHAPATG